MTAYERVGEGFPILVLPGFGCGRWLFRDMAERLQEQACFVLMDSRGMGSAPSASEPYDLADLAKDGLALMDRLGFDEFGLVGISMGGMTALETVRLAPRRVRFLMLLCSLGPGEGFLPPPTLSEDDIYRIYGALDQPRLERLVSASAHVEFAREQPDRFQWWVARRMEDKPAPDQLVFQAKAVTTYLEGGAAFEHIECPTLILTGAQDRFVVPENSRLLARVIAHARLVEVERAGHLFFFEQSETVAREISSFLGSVWAFR